MSTEYIRNTVFQHIKNSFIASEVQYENLDSLDVGERVAPFTNVSLRFTGNEQVSFGEPPVIRQRGAVQADIYVKSGKGTKSGYEIADSFSALFSRLSLSGIEFDVPTTLTPLVVAGWHRLTVRAPFYFDNLI